MEELKQSIEEDLDEHHLIVEHDFDDYDDHIKTIDEIF